MNKHSYLILLLLLSLTMLPAPLAWGEEDASNQDWGLLWETGHAAVVEPYSLTLATLMDPIEYQGLYLTSDGQRLYAGPYTSVEDNLVILRVFNTRDRTPVLSIDLTQKIAAQGFPRESDWLGENLAIVKGAAFRDGYAAVYGQVRATPEVPNILVFSMETGEVTHRLHVLGGGEIQRLLWSPSTDNLIVLRESIPGEEELEEIVPVLVFSVKSDEIVSVLPPGEDFTPLSLDPRGMWVLGYGYYGTIQLRNAQTLRSVWSLTFDRFREMTSTVPAGVTWCDESILFVGHNHVLYLLEDPGKLGVPRPLINLTSQEALEAAFYLPKSPRVMSFLLRGESPEDIEVHPFRRGGGLYAYLLFKGSGGLVSYIALVDLDAGRYLWVEEADYLLYDGRAEGKPSPVYEARNERLYASHVVVSGDGEHLYLTGRREDTPMTLDLARVPYSKLRVLSINVTGGGPLMTEFTLVLPNGESLELVTNQTLYTRAGDGGNGTRLQPRANYIDLYVLPGTYEIRWTPPFDAVVDAGGLIGYQSPYTYTTRVTLGDWYETRVVQLPSPLEMLGGLVIAPGATGTSLKISWGESFTTLSLEAPRFLYAVPGNYTIEYGLPWPKDADYVYVPPGRKVELRGTLNVTVHEGENKTLALPGYDAVLPLYTITAPEGSMILLRPKGGESYIVLTQSAPPRPFKARLAPGEYELMIYKKEGDQALMYKTQVSVEGGTPGEIRVGPEDLAPPQPSPTTASTTPPSTAVETSATGSSSPTSASPATSPEASQPSPPSTTVTPTPTTPSETNTSKPGSSTAPQTGTASERVEPTPSTTLSPGRGGGVSLAVAAAAALVVVAGAAFLLTRGRGG